ncbi:MAG: hypothetical protein COB83_07165 [Gammaproteobacteria bacterium]|nr:MAG: hypothetical protein COB83_07165 [Gammaproteobacteria bacterium]
MKKRNIIDDWLKENGDPEITKRVNSEIEHISKGIDTLICGFELGVENCGFVAKDAFTCKYIRKCDLCGN